MPRKPVVKKAPKLIKGVLKPAGKSTKPVKAAQKPANLDPMEQIYVCRVTLLGSDPPIWRRVAVPGFFTLEDLHWVIQCAMKWDNSHLHEFIFGKGRSAKHYGMPPDDEDPFMDFDEVSDDTLFPLGEVITPSTKSFKYVYDFGDCWEHEVKIEKRVARDKETSYPVCLAGEMAAPLEDSGGIGGHYHNLEILRNKKHPEHKSLLEWMGGPFDPEHFDLNEANNRLRQIFRQ